MDAREVDILHSKHSIRIRTRAAMNLHNNHAGRQTILENVRLRCKCHGVSGSCDLKTCWKVHPSVRTLGKIFRSKFDQAQEIQPDWILYPRHKDESHIASEQGNKYILDDQRSSFQTMKNDNLGQSSEPKTLTHHKVSNCFPICLGDP